MNEPSNGRERYSARVSGSNGPSDELVFAFVPMNIAQERGMGGSAKRVPRYVIMAHEEGSGFVLSWSEASDDPGPDRAVLEAEVTTRMNERANWLDRVTTLMDQVERWAKELGWATRRIEKRIEDSRIGAHQVPALLMQEGVCRIILEPVGTSTPGTEGIVDLYLMPAYDDIARLYYHDGQWHVLDQASGLESGHDESLLLSKETFEGLLEGLRQDAK